MAGGILRRLRIPGKLEDPDIKDLSLVRRAANREKVIMAKAKDGDPVVYDFSNIDDKAKSAIALAHEAVKDEAIMDSLPDEVGEFFKSAAKELKLDTTKAAHPEPDDDDDEKDKDESDDDKKKRLANLKKAEEEKKEKEAMKKTEMIKSAFPGVLESVEKSVVEPLKVEIKKAQDTIDQLTDKLQRDEMRELAGTLVTNGDKPTDEKVDELITIRKSMDDKGWSTFIEGQRGIVVQLEKSQLFERQSHPAAASAGSAYAQLDAIAKGIIEKSEDKDAGKAWEHAVETNPTLYNTYRKEQAAQAKAGAAS